MLKRKSEGGGDESPAKKNQAGIASEGMVNPIPRHLPLQSITLNFYQATWEEIAPGGLYYLPLSQNPKYMFDASMINQFNKFKELWESMEIHTPKFKISNLIMLQDDLRVQSNTPTDATAFTQVVYMIKYCPKGMKQYFQLGNLNKEDQTSITPLTYMLAPIKDETGKATQLVTINGFENFEKLTIHGAQSDYTGGFVPNKRPALKARTYELTEPYIAPNSDSLLAVFSANLRPEQKYFIPPSHTLTMARNLDKKTFYKYGDVIEESINTNLEGVHLYNTLSNHFLDEQIVSIQDPTSPNLVSYEGEFCWPSRNRPYLSRSNYFDKNTLPITEGKNFKQLDHCFLAMPPIRKPNGALLGQRCSFLLEQTISVTFHMAQATFFDTEEEDAAQMRQDSSVVLRRNAYRTPRVEQPQTTSVFCNTSSVCPTPVIKPLAKFADDKPCYDDSFAGLFKFFEANPAMASQVDLPEYVKFLKSDVIPSNAFDCNTLPNNRITLELIDSNQDFKKYWHEQLYKDGIVRLFWRKDQQPPKDVDGEHWVYMSGDNQMNMPLIKQGLDVEFPNYIEFNVAEMLAHLFFPYASNTCKLEKKYVPVPDRVINVFYT